MIDPKSLIAQYDVEEFCATADAYYRRIDDPTPLMSKPFSFVHETPEMLQNLGLLLSGLHLGKTMSVLDFGAGTCWLSRFLTQLNCQVFCCDPSAAALDIGRRLFEEVPLIGTVVYRPRFLRFDGHRIDLPDESVDRIVCFDTFHHVPNQQEVLSELARVLRKGGIAGFSEPGRRHSHSPASQYEMRNHAVLENDIDLDDIFRCASRVGFSNLTVKLISDMEVPLTEYHALYDDTRSQQIRAEISNNVYNTTFNRSIFFLHKGPRRRDSRSHEGLSHSLQSSSEIVRALRGTGTCDVSFTLENTGDASWLNTNSEIFGIVRLGSHLYSAAGDLIEIDYSRHDLPAPVEPGQRITMTARVPLPEAGSYRLAFDLVAEGITWFENLGSHPVYLELVVS